VDGLIKIRWQNGHIYELRLTEVGDLNGKSTTTGKTLHIKRDDR
jgi:hypothetical protein